MTKNKKKLILIILAILISAAAFTGTIFMLSTLQNPPHEDQADTTQDSDTSPEASADSLQSQAYQAVQNNDPSKAKQLFQEARQAYIDSNNIDGVADADAQLYLIDHPTVAPEVEAKPAPTATR